MTPWTAVHQAPLWESPIKNTGECCHFLLQGIFPTQGSNPCLLCLLYWQNRSVLQRHRVSISDEPVISIQFCVTSQIIFFPFKSFVEEEEAYLSFFFLFFMLLQSITQFWRTCTQLTYFYACFSTYVCAH